MRVRLFIYIKRGWGAIAVCRRAGLQITLTLSQQRAHTWTRGTSATHTRADRRVPRVLLVGSGRSRRSIRRTDTQYIISCPPTAIGGLVHAPTVNTQLANQLCSPAVGRSHSKHARIKHNIVLHPTHSRMTRTSLSKHTSARRHLPLEGVTRLARCLTRYGLVQGGRPVIYSRPVHGSTARLHNPVARPASDGSPSQLHARAAEQLLRARLALHTLQALDALYRVCKQVSKCV